MHNRMVYTVKKNTSNNLDDIITGLQFRSKLVLNSMICENLVSILLVDMEKSYLTHIASNNVLKLQTNV